ncbi:MAG: glycoside hydrolase family 113 [Planctomycetota bacterium]
MLRIVKFAFVVTALAGGVLAIASTLTLPAGPGPGGLTSNWTAQRLGVTWEVAGPVNEEDIKWLASTGANGIVQMPFPQQLRTDEPELIHPDYRVWGQRDDGLRVTSRLARKYGISTLLKPHLYIVDRSTGFWPGDIRMPSREKWDLWFSNYRKLILHYAQLAAEEGMETLCVGAELRQTMSHEKEWRALIADVRKIYPGIVMYSVNWDDYEDFTFPDAVDAIGVQAYFPIAYGLRPTRRDMELGWEHALKSFDKWVQKVNKPIVFTEVGFHSCQGSFARPWEWKFPGMPVDFEIQAEAYDVTLNVLLKRPWLRGIYIWKWLPGQPNPAIPSDDGFYPQGKPAEDVMRKHFKNALSSK